MSHGTPDWGLTAGTSKTYQLTDLAEAVARLGALDRFDRRGEVLFETDFHNGLSGWLLEVTAHDLVYLSNTWFVGGPFAARIAMDGTGVGLAGLSRQVPFASVSGFGCEFSFHISALLTYQFFEMDVVDGSRDWRYVLRYDPVNNLLQQESPAGVWVTVLANLDLSGAQQSFHTLKMVSQSGGTGWARLIVDSQEVVPALPPVNAGAAGGLTYVYILFSSQSGGTGFAGDVWLDDVIVTHNEPY